MSKDQIHNVSPIKVFTSAPTTDRVPKKKHVVCYIIHNAEYLTLQNRKSLFHPGCGDMLRR